MNNFETDIDLSVTYDMKQFFKEGTYLIRAGPEPIVFALAGVTVLKVVLCCACVDFRSAITHDRCVLTAVCLVSF